MKARLSLSMFYVAFGVGKQLIMVCSTWDFFTGADPTQYVLLFL